MPNNSNTVDKIKNLFGPGTQIIHSTPRLVIIMDGYGVGYIILDRNDKKVNVLDVSFLRDLDAALTIVSKTKSIGTLVFYSLKKVFLAGADVTEIYPLTEAKPAIQASEACQKIFNRIEDFPIPTIAAIHGAALGGGLELALSCSYRIASIHKSTMLGLPEVQLGLLPGAGGTYRLPKLIGLEGSLTMILSGRSVRAEKAKRLGIVSKIFSAEDRYPNENRFLLSTRRFANSIYFKYLSSVKKAKKIGKSPQRLYQKAKILPFGKRMMQNNALGIQIVTYATMKNLNKLTRGRYPAPYAAFRCVLNGIQSTSRKRALAFEARTFAKLVISPESKNLISIFFLREKSKTCPIKTLGPLPKTNHVGVIGAGVMGSAIAQLTAYKDFGVHMKDIKDSFVKRGLENVDRLFADSVKRKRLTKYEMIQKRKNLTADTLYTGFQKSDIIIEAAVENMKIKKIVLKQTEAELAPNAIFATNTSSLSITQLATASRNPANVVGLHFFNPVTKLPLVEIIRGKETSDETMARTYALALKLGKIPVIVNDAPGFVVNRILGIYMSEANHLLFEGCSIEQVDKALVTFGLPMGPFRLLDEVGLDVSSHVSAILEQGLGKQRFGRIPEFEGLLKNHSVFKNRLGKKTGSGFYKYHPKTRRSQGIDPIVVAALNRFRKPRVFSDNDIVDRCIYLMVNEASYILSEGVCSDPSTVDLAMVFGTGFAPFRGGLLSYADTIGLPTILKRLQGFVKSLGPRFTICPLLAKMAENGEKFYPKRPYIPWVEKKSVPRF